MNEYTLFLAHFNTIPNIISEIKIDCKKAHKWFAEKFKHEIKDMHFNKRYFKKSKIAEHDDIFYILYDDLLVDFDSNNAVVRFLFRNTEITKIEEIIAGVKKFKKIKPKRKPQISLLLNMGNCINTKSMEITKPRLSIVDNYNDDFKDIHQTILYFTRGKLVNFYHQRIGISG